MSELQKRIATALGDRYAVEREIGRGGMAAVFLAADRKHDRKVAVKVLHPELAAVIGGDRFLREINIAAHLRHPHIVPLLDSGDSDGLLYYVMPFIEGESLRQRLAVNGRLEVTEAVRYWRDVVDAIAYAHRHGILHRDLKPENVLLADRHASLVDFGIGKFLSEAGEDSTLTAAGMALGTPAYMAPEQAMATDEIDHRSDIYALGVLGYEMLAGRVPFATGTPAQLATKLTAAAPDVREVRPEVPPEFSRLIKRCLEPEQKHRWQSAEELLEAVESTATPVPATASAPAAWHRVLGSPRRRNGALAAILLAAVAVIAFAYVSISKTRTTTWARETGLPELRRLTEAAINDSAFLLAARLRAVLPAEPEADTLWKRVSTTATLRTSPAGARVYWTAYRGDTSNWQPLGETPLEEIPVPAPARGGQISILLKYEKSGYRTALRPLGIERRASTPLVLDSATAGDTELRVRGGIVAAPSPTRLAGDTLLLPDFFIDRLEVTNQQYKKFVVAGGYTRKDLWDFPFTSSQGELAFDSAMSRFRDKTGRPGPASWEGGDFPPGRENYPVSGISWYEAQAYAKFAGKQLPTIFHWRRAAQGSGSSWILPLSNIEGSALSQVGAFKGMTPFGATDMAGNVREWCVNANGTNRYILGGSWSDHAYIFHDAISADPMDRSEINGVRLIRNIPVAGSASNGKPDPLARPLPRGFRDYAAEKPASVAELQSFLPVFDYDRSPLNAVVEKSDSSDPRWIKQTIAFDAAYAQERMRAYLFLPRNVKPPYQTAVFFPGASTVDVRSSRQLIALPDFVVANGRALLHPIYKDTYERGGNESTPMGTDPVYNMTGGLLGPITYRDHVVMYVKDLRRSVDYLATREDVDMAKLAYIGFSWGGRLGPINLSAERRFRTAVFYLPGLNFAPKRRETDEFNYLPHVKLPTLILSGRYDDVFPLQTSVVHFVERLGTPAAHKRHRTYPTQHFLPREEMIRETLDWLDRYLGKVGR